MAGFHPIPLRESGDVWRRQQRLRLHRIYPGRKITPSSQKLNTNRRPNVGLMLGQRLRRWPNINPACTHVDRPIDVVFDNGT